MKTGIALFAATVTSVVASEHAALVHARAILGQPGVVAELRIDPSLAHPEAFQIEREGDRTVIVAGGPGGALYGAQEVRDRPTNAGVIGAEGQPDFAVRGAVLMMLSPSWNYQSDLSPEIYPWFFDRPLMTRYLDHLLSARLNTLVLWSGHLFPHILELPEYPDASQFPREAIRRNQEQFRWLAQECAKRNITILTHFYNIHITEHQAKALGREGKDNARYTAPDEWVGKYYYACLTRYFEEFSNVGLYICPGESLGLEHQVPWFRDVIFKAARDSGKHPRLVIRDWTMADDFRAALPSLYDNLWSELKHNDETITSPWPDVRHQKWKGVLSGHIVNLHDPADAVPYRVGSPRLLGEMVWRWHREEMFTGAWFYPPQAWCWPYTLDLGRDGQDARLLAFERDELWHLLEGRYLWRADRHPGDELQWVDGWLGRKFGDPGAGRLLREWYDLTGPILPGLQNVTAVRFGNFFPTSIAWVQAQVDDILSFRTRIDETPATGPTGLTNQRYYSRPVDSVTIEHYRKVHPGVYEERRSMPVAQLAAELAAGREPRNVLRADYLLDVYATMAREALARARSASARPVSDRAEIQRFVQDSECLVLTVEFYRLKVRAALQKRLFELTKKPEHAARFRQLMDESVPAYERMFTHARKAYRAGSSMWDAKPWDRAFDEKVKLDHATQLKWLAEQGVHD